MTWAKVVFLSALTKKRLHTLMPEIISAYENNRREVKTSLLNNVIIDAAKLHEAPGYKGKKLKIYFALGIITISVSPVNSSSCFIFDDCIPGSNNEVYK
jgi:predicted GTPase